MNDFYEWLEREYISEIEKMLEIEEMSSREMIENQKVEAS